MNDRSARSTITSVFTKYRLLFLFLFFVLLLIFINIALTQINGSILLSRNWRVNVVIHSSPVTVVSFPKNINDRALVVSIPSNVSAGVPYGYGFYRLEAVWRLGELEKRDELFAKAVENVLGVKVQAWLGQSEPSYLDTQSESFTILSQIKSTYSLFNLNSFGGNLNLLDKFILVRRLSQLNPKNTLVYASHDNSFLFTDSILPDGTAIKIVNKDALNSFLEQKFEDEEVRDEALSLQVLNTTKKPGLGTEVSRFLTQFGGKVLTVGNESIDIENCLIKTPEENFNKKIVQFLHQEFGCSLFVDDQLSDADVQLLIGDQMAEELVP